jgi:hypothetical protein
MQSASTSEQSWALPAAIAVTIALSGGCHCAAAVLLLLLLLLLPMQLSDKEVRRLVTRLEGLDSRLQSHPLWQQQQLLPWLVTWQHKVGLTAAARQAKKDLKAAQVGGEKGERGQDSSWGRTAARGPGGAAVYGVVCVAVLQGRLISGDPAMETQQCINGSTAHHIPHGLISCSPPADC